MRLAFGGAGEARSEVISKTPGDEMAGKKLRQQQLTIYLAKAGPEEPGFTIVEPEALSRFPISDDNGRLGTLYVEVRGSWPPRWSRFFEPQVKASQLGRQSSTAAVFHVIFEKRVFLLCFGQGWHLLRHENLEERFGLKVTLNCIGENRIRSIDKHTLDTVGRLTRVQASKESGPSEFGIDVERDLLRAITGKPDDKIFGNTLSGLDSLHVSAEVTLQTLRALLSGYLNQFGKQTYRQKFPWVDHVSETNDDALKDHLDTLMLKQIERGHRDKCWLAIPDPIEWIRIDGFRYRRGRRHAVYDDLDLNSFQAELEIEANKLTADFLRKHQVLAVDGEDQEQYAWPVYKCIYCEVEYKKDTYLLSVGRWYKISSDFVDQVNAFYRKIDFVNLSLPEYSDQSEEMYNERVSKENPDLFALMDRELISIGGGYSKIEFCDLYGRDGDLIHIKRYGGSGVLSHLFFQGIISGQLFAGSPEFRQAVNAKLPEPYRIGSPENRPDLSLYRIVFAVVSRKDNGKLTLPFFSRLGIKNAIQTLQGYGYRVAICKILVSEAISKRKKFKS